MQIQGHFWNILEPPLALARVEKPIPQPHNIYLSLRTRKTPFLPLLSLLSLAGFVRCICALTFILYSYNNEYFRKTLVSGEKNPLNLVGVFRKKQQPLLLPLQTLFKEQNTFSKLWTDRLETCKLFADFTWQQPRTSNPLENMERTGYEV